MISLSNLYIYFLLIVSLTFLIFLLKYNNKMQLKYNKIMEIASFECVFLDCLESCSDSEKCFSSKPLSENQTDVVINSSHKRHDGFAKSFKQSKTILNYHTSCYATCTSKSKIKRYLKAKRKHKEQMEGPKRKHLRSRK